MESIFKKIIKKITNRTKMLLAKPSLEKIYHINFAVTYGCNSRCKHCNIWRKSKENTKIIEKELKLTEIEKTFEESQYLNCIQSIGITGGEPFLRKDLTDLCVFLLKNFRTRLYQFQPML